MNPTPTWVSYLRSLLPFAIAGTLLRLWMATLGHNYDVDSWTIMSEVALRGENPYTTWRYNYAPTSAYLLTSLRWLQELVVPLGEFSTDSQSLPHDLVQPYHLTVTFFLSMVDLAIAAWLCRHVQRSCGIVYLLHPAIVMLTGFHAQIENTGVLFILLATAALMAERPRWGWAIAFMTLSLQMKHLAIFFPVWILFRREFPLLPRLLFCAIPWAVFSLSFMPFLANPVAKEALTTITLKHSSFHLSAFFPEFTNAFFPTQGVELVGQELGINKAFKYLFFAMIFLWGWALRRIPLHLSPIYHLAVFVVFSSGISDQYLTIAMVYAALHWKNPLMWLFGGITTLVLLGSHYNVGSLPAMVEINRMVRGLGFWRWHGLAWIFLDLVWRLYEYHRQQSNSKVF